MKIRAAGTILPSLTSIRAVAAVAVAICHARAAWPWPHHFLFNWIGQIGWLGVPLFFILSGFVLMWSFGENIGGVSYVLRRLTRIYPLHLLCFTLSLSAFAALGSPLAGYVGTSVGTILNVLLLQGWVPGHPEIRQAWNGVSWTLSCEFFFYLCTPFIFPYLMKLKAKQSFALALALWLLLGLCAGLASFWRMNDALDFLKFSPFATIFIFIIGAAGVGLMRGKYKLPSPSISILLIVIPLIGYCQIVDEKERVDSLMYFIMIPGALFLILGLAKKDSSGTKSLLDWSPFRILGESSYALYMIHALWLGIFGFLVVKISRSLIPHDELGDLGFLITFLFTSIVFSLVLHYCFELPVRRFLLSLMKMRQSKVY